MEMEYTIETLANGTPVCVSKTHRFGTDSLLLAWFAQPWRQHKAVDLGSGCGIVALRWHDMGHRGECLAVELQPEGTALLTKSIEMGNITHITPKNEDMRNFPSVGTYQMVACNPPYFTGGFVSPKPGRGTARHQQTCTTKDVTAVASRLLTDGGKFCLCQRPEQLAEVICAARAVRLEPKRLQWVKVRPDSVPWLFLLECQKNRRPGMVLERDIIVQAEDGSHSAQILEIYGREQQP